MIVSAPKKICFELEKCILHGGWNANDSEVEPEPSFLQTVAFVVAGESIKPRFAQTFRANISIDVFYFARERNKVIFRIFELVTFKEYEDLKWKIQYWWFSTLPLSKLLKIKGTKKILLQFLRVHSFHSSLVGTTFIWQISSCRAPTSAIITFIQIWPNESK